MLKKTILLGGDARMKAYDTTVLYRYMRIRARRRGTMHA
jgi:hypothetical protein